MAQLRLFSSVLNGFIEFAGNTLGVTTVGSTSPIAINQLIVDSTPPPGGIPLTNWANANSAAFLTGKTGSTVVKAYLSWYGQSVPNVSGSQTSVNNAVTLLDPSGTTTNISPNPAWSQSTVFNGALTWFTRVADVTSIVTSNGIGKYTVGKVPSGANFSGWTLAVVWRNSSLPPRFISIDSFCTYNDSATGPINITIGGFITPASGTVNGRAALVVTGAESNTNSGPVSFGPNATSLVALSGPRNPATGFFQCQICDSNSESANVGNLDTTASWGNNNNPLNSNPIANVRWHFDQTNVSINQGLTNSQSSGLFRYSAAPNVYIINQIALQVDAQAAGFNPVKSVSKTSAQPGDELTYTLVFSNIGNNASNNAIVVDTLPANVTFIPDSLTLNGTPQSGASPLPPTGFNAGSVAVSATKTITFRVTVNTVPTGTILENSYSVGYTYTPSNAPSTTLASNDNSNTVITTVIDPPVASVLSVKTVNKNFADVNDTLNYTIVLNISGNSSVANAVFLDTIPTDTSFIANSFKINGVTITGANPNPPTGINIGTLPNPSVQTITFSVVIDTIPNPNPISNSSSLSATFPDSTNPISSNSNTVTTQVNNASLENIIKLVDKSFAKCGDTITYTIKIPNSGNVTAQNIRFKDTIPNGTVLVPTSVFINGVNQIGANPAAGVTVPNISPGATATLTFDVQVQC